MEEKIKNSIKIAKFHNKNYKKLLLIPLVLLILSIIYMISFYNVNNDFMHRDISLTGGTFITIYDQISIPDLIQSVENQLNEISTREIYDLVTGEKQAIIIETTSDADTARQVLESYLGYELTSENSSFEFTGSTLSQSFYRQLLFAILVAFFFMALVIFLIFRTFMPSLAVVLSAFADIFMTLVVIDILGIKMSTAGIVAFLMLIGYSVDTDILLTNRLLKGGSGSVNEKIFNSFKTGITMTLTSLLAMFVALIMVRSFSPILSQIFTILVIGLLFDILNTWITNVSLLKWYIERRK